MRLVPSPENVQFSYIFATDKPLTEDRIDELGITATDIQYFQPGTISHTNLLSFLPGAHPTSPVYSSPLTAGMIADMEAKGELLGAVKYNDLREYFFQNPADTPYLFPYGNNKNWTLSNYGGTGDSYIPKKAKA